MVAEGNGVENEDAPLKVQPKEPPKPKLLYTLEILKVIKDAQQQHGLRHEDYQRYRGYCTRRIERLRKTLHLPQGDKRHFKKRDVTEQHLKDEKFLHIPLMLAERAWAYAMQLRQEANTEPRKKFHLVSRLRKAASYAIQLQTLCEVEVCDARTKLEAQAYVSWIVGVLNFELKLWKEAMKNLKEAQVVYEKLVTAMNEDDTQVYNKHKAEELTPRLLYCEHNIKDQTGIEDLMQLRSQAHGDLLSSLDSLMIQSKEHHAQVLSEVEWRGRSVAVRSERVRVFLLAERALDASLGQNVGDNIELLESHLMDCKDAIGTVKEEVKQDPNSKNRTPAQGLSSLQYLHSYLIHIRLERTIQRNLLLAEQAKENLKKSESSSQQGEGKKPRPQDLVRLYEIILQNLGELQQLGGVEEDSDYQEDVEIRIKTYKAFRCYYIGRSLAALRRWRDCVALYSRATSYASDALKSISKASSSEVLKSELVALESEIDAHRYSALAYSVLESEGDASELTGVTGAKLGAKVKKVPLAERLDEYYEDPGLATKSASIIKLPPDMTPIPCKPLFFDLAQNQLDYPPLEDKLDVKVKPAASGAQPAGISGFVKGLWGWGGAKQ